MQKADHRIFELSQIFSSNVIEALQELPELEGVYVGGSISRYEALPMSDLDLVYFGGGKEFKNADLKEIDRIDNFSLTNFMAGRLFACMSPECGLLDSRPLHGSHHLYYESHNKKEFLVNRLLWEYTFSRVFNERSSQEGYNLKYSIGAYRDILFINWFARIISPSLNFHEKKPEIVRSINIIDGILKFSPNEILDDIAFIMFTKSVVLCAHADTNSRGRTPLNERTLNAAIKCNAYFGSFFKKDPDLFWKKYMASKQRINEFLDKIFQYTLKENNVTIYDYIKLALAMAQKKKSYKAHLLLKEKESETFPVRACMIFNKQTSPATLREIAEICVNDPGHFYTNRLIAKSPSVDNATLRLLLEKSRFAIDSSTNNRYRKLVQDKLREKS